jgi:hypothetical protein
VGADESAQLAYRDADLRGPLAMVVGSEGRGIAGHVRRRLDLVVRIPMHGRVASLNAAVAGSVLLFEAAAQRPAPVRPPSSEARIVVPPAADAAPELHPEPEAEAASPGESEHADPPEPEDTARPEPEDAAAPEPGDAPASEQAPAAPDDLLPGEPG